MNRLLTNGPAIALLLQFQTPKRHRLAIYIWNLIDCISDCEWAYWNILAYKYLGLYQPTAIQINGILGIAGHNLENKKR